MQKILKKTGLPLVRRIEDGLYYYEIDLSRQTLDGSKGGIHGEYYYH